MDKRLVWGLIFLVSACLSAPATPAPSPTTVPTPTETPLPTPTVTATPGPTITGQGRLIYLLGSKVYGGGFSGDNAREIAALAEGLENVRKFLVAADTEGRNLILILDQEEEETFKGFTGR